MRRWINISLRTSRVFGSRGPSEIKLPNRKFIFVFEGEKTEKQYFEGLFNNRVELGINGIINFKTLEREDGSRSHQKKVVEGLHSYLQQIVTFKKDKDRLLDDIKEEIERDGSLDFNNLKDSLEKAINEVEDADKNLSELISIFDEFESKSLDITNFLIQLNTLKGNLDYDPDYDKVCIILDRDEQSFKANQYDDVIQICNENNYRLGITNPCFEFWLILHFTDLDGYDLNDIQENKKYNKNRRYLEKILIDFMGSYKKNRIDFDQFKPNIHEAIKRERMFCEDPKNLKECLGSSVGTIINDLMN